MNHSTSETTIQIPNYQITETIYSGSRTIVYRGVRLDQQLPVVIKLLKNPYPSFSELVQFRNQYIIARNLKSPDIIKTYSLEPYQNSYALVMEDFGGISLQEWAIQRQRRLSLSEFLEIAITLSKTLDFLYHEGIIHKDIKPSNILIHPETKQVKLIDFSIASLLPHETQDIQNPNVLEGTLAYISPEQTGRMNREIDYRTDFYSLGVTFYELLTGELPFQSQDLMELVHCHIAKMPSALGNREEIPLVISKIVMKLMAKNAEDRYQSALGLKDDLEKCQVQLKETGQVGYFEIAQRDLCDCFRIPEKLYGRETEVQQLLDAFERVTQGHTEIMLIAGFSGVGKTAVVNEIHKPIVRQRGYFIKGKFDQFNRNIPFSAFVQAFRNLIAQLLSETDTRLEEWKTNILSALGENGKVIIEVIPELETIIGEQPNVAELSGGAAQKRFNLLFQKFTQVFTSAEHPLVIFLDDLQWADSASLNLIQLLTNETAKYLLLIGAYRDHEVSSVHPLMLMLEEIHKAGTLTQTMTLAPLSQKDLNHLIADTLHCSLKLAQPLTELLYQKTKGNPFFTTVFLKVMHEEGILKFDFQLRHWECDITPVKMLALTGDVVEFMAMQLQKLAQPTQEVLKLAACIGNQFDLGTLAIVHEKSLAETAADLWPALQEGLILPENQVYKFFQDAMTDGENAAHAIAIHNLGKNVERDSITHPSYRFLHDRVQQAAYSLIPESQKTTTHYKIGQLLRQNTSPEDLELRIFDLVNQFNHAREQITEESAKIELAQLNLMAGNKAKISTAYTSAIKYFSLGIAALPEKSWKIHYSLTFSLYREWAECEYSAGNYAQAEAGFEVALNSAQNIFDQADIYVLLMALRMSQGDNIYASIEAGLKGLSLLGMTLPTTPEELQILTEAELEKLQSKLKILSPADLFELPEMTDSTQKACVRILSVLWSASFLAGNQPLAYLSSLLILNLSLEYGNTETSSMAYDLYGINLATQGEYRTAYEFGELALKLAHHFNNLEVLPKNLNHFGHAINPYINHLKTNITIYQQSFQVCNDTGNLLYGVWAVVFIIFTMLIKGDNLSDVATETEKYLSYVCHVNDANMLEVFNLQREFVLNLKNLSKGESFLATDHPETPASIELFQNNNFAIGVSWYCLLKLKLLYLQGRYQEAIQGISELESKFAANLGFFPVTLYYLYYPLCLTAIYFEATSEEQKQYWEVLKQHQQKMANWAEYCPENFLHKSLLLSAEMARISENSLEAANLYDRAIQLAKENQYLQEEAIGNELAARFYLQWNKPRIAQEYMTEAYYSYARWGAQAKVADLEIHYPQLLRLILEQQQPSLNPSETLVFHGTSSLTHNSNNSVSNVLDFTSVLKAAQVISSSLELDTLISSLTRIILENSGAKKAVLILPENTSWYVQAIASVEQEKIPTIVAPQFLEDCQDIPVNIVHYVKNTKQTIEINNCQTDIPWLIGEYMLKYQPHSVLCTPILNQGNLVGILYLENPLTSWVFTRERLSVINLLSSQASISLENARLYQQSQQALEDLQQAQLQMIQSEKMSALGNLVAGVAHEMNNPLGFIFASLKQAQPTVTDLIQHLKLYQNSLPNPGAEILEHAEEIDLDYSLEDLPKVIDAMTIACDRLKHISTSLRTFSRADKDYKIPFNIHEGIDSTLLILKHRLKANSQRSSIEVIKNYADLPKINCFPGQLNQVFMNIIANAIDALDEASQVKISAELPVDYNCITITTSLEGEQVKIAIADNAHGMSEEVKQKIFEHLFTTKPIGKGTGLGLAIARQIIVEKHKGLIEVNSRMGEGSEFIITLPTKT